uniref:Putative p63 n=1 Tax=Rhipicephalus pulchellus TaxID=72859 RepID=L7M2F0_RHIPC
MMMTERAIKQTQASVSRVRRAIEQRLQQRLQLHERLAEQEKVQLRIGLLKEVIEERSRQLEKEKVACQVKAQELADKEKQLATMAAELVEKRNTLVERRRHYFEVRENLLKTSSRLLFRQKELITELAFIYPIVSFPEAKGYTICLVHLPNSEDFNDREDQMVSVALGYVTHTLLMMSHFLDMPLRYPLIHCGSMSSVRDNLIEHFTDKEREFPLYMKGKDRMTFNYGVYLLNRNIAQLRCYCNIVTKDLRTTLHNLHGLYEFYSIKQNSQPSSAPVPVPASPLAVPIKSNNNVGSSREQRSSDEVLSPPTVKREDMEHIFKCEEERSGGAEASSAPQKLSSSLDKGLDNFQSTATTESEDKRSIVLPVKFPTLKSSYRLSEPNLREFEARTMLKERRAATEHLLPAPPVVYDATESGSLNSGDGAVEVAVDTLFDADLTARTEQLASAVRSFRTYSSISSSNGLSPKP